MFGLDQSPRYACRSTSPPPPAPLPRSGFVLRPISGRHRRCHYCKSTNLEHKIGPNPLRIQKTLDVIQ